MPEKSIEGVWWDRRWGNAALQSQQRGSSGIERWSPVSYKVIRGVLAASRNRV
ncbi:hypothetical protein DPMN_156276 [Dreissena polymorpha]|uniref:Uncharacterized protein n=1 Tax=Dreissena polymorpha TaxID=45954 RepID=A0A9D4FPH4_DREPO|nr:hypothetical protein DPMN_156276 [Dreissena polymorpha]